ncbi:MAG: M23 family metallopeptidase [Lutibacter sp.]|uniref:M23 family metallopeptidase n=1 Tax=Lutibacter sp. TaxID=1925666 RepID=UPI00385B236B
MQNFKQFLFLFLVVVFNSCGGSDDSPEPVIDKTPPTAPTNLQGDNITKTSLDLTWIASTDNVGVTAYILYKNGINYVATTSTTYTITELNSNTNYNFKISAKDAAENESVFSNVLEITTEQEDLDIPENVNVIWPLSGDSTFSPNSGDEIADGYGPRMLSGNYDFHRGIDFPEPTGTPIYTSLRGGQVVRVEASQPGSTFERWGNWVVIAYPASSHPNPDHSSVFQIAYLHLSSVNVNVGQNISIGEKIGEVGNTGVGINTEHLHFEYYDTIDSGLIQKRHSRNPFTLLPYTTITPTVTSSKSNSVITVNIEQTVPSLDVVEIALLVDEITINPVLNFEQRIGMDINDEDNDTYTDIDGTVINVAPTNFSEGDSMYYLSITFTNDVFSSISNYQVKLTNAKGEEFIY